MAEKRAKKVVEPRGVEPLTSTLPVQGLQDFPSAVAQTNQEQTRTEQEMKQISVPVGPMTNTGKEQPDVVRIAEGLSEAQKFLIVHGNRPPAFMKELCVTWRQLQRRGIGGDVTLMPLGQAVRDYLTGELK